MHCGLYYKHGCTHFQTSQQKDKRKAMKYRFVSISLTVLVFITGCEMFTDLFGPGQPNLVAESVHITQNDDVQFTVLNVGDESLVNVEIGIYFSSDIAIAPDDEVVHTVFLTIGANLSAIIAIPIDELSNIGSIADGVYYVGIIVDPSNRVDEENETDNTNVAMVSVEVSSTPNVAPTAPTTVTATEVSSTQVILDWADSSTNEDGFEIARSDDGGATFTVIATVAADVISYTDTTVAPNSNYQFVVRAFNTVGTADSAVVSVTTLVAGTVAAPTFSPPAGTYTSAQSVTIATATSGATIRYTTDGTSPTATQGTLYTGAITVATTTSLRAIAYQSSRAASAVTSATYTLTLPAVVTTLAGSGTWGSADGTGTAAKFRSPRGVAVDSAGNVYVADTNNHRIRKITPSGVVSTLAGSGIWGSADGTGTAAQFKYPTGVAVDSAGNVYVADYANNRIRKITPP